MSCRVANPEDRFSRDETHISLGFESIVVVEVNEPSYGQLITLSSFE